MTAFPLRPVLVVAALALAAALVLEPTLIARAESPLQSIDVRRSDGTYVVEATLLAPVPLAVAWQVLTDFERMETFIPNLKDSRIVGRDGNDLVIRQHGVARFGPLSYTFESERKVVLSPPVSVRSTQLRGNMRRVESLTTFEPDGSGTRIAYHAEIEPGSWFPALVTREFLRHEIEEQFTAIVAEMVRRKGPG